MYSIVRCPTIAGAAVASLKKAATQGRSASSQSTCVILLLSFQVKEGPCKAFGRCSGKFASPDVAT